VGHPGSQQIKHGHRAGEARGDIQFIPMIWPIGPVSLTHDKRTLPHRVARAVILYVLAGLHSLFAAGVAT
jgi:hypothetical protein